MHRDRKQIRDDEASTCLFVVTSTERTHASLIRARPAAHFSLTRHDVLTERSRKRTKIVATIGPASRAPAILRSLVDAGLNVARLNFSHGTHAEHAATIADIRRVASDAGVPLAILQDLPGPKVRTGVHAGGVDFVRLENGAHFFLSTTPVEGTSAGVAVSYAGLAHDVGSR